MDEACVWRRGGGKEPAPKQTGLPKQSLSEESSTMQDLAEVVASTARGTMCAQPMVAGKKCQSLWRTFRHSEVSIFRTVSLITVGEMTSALLLIANDKGHYRESFLRQPAGRLPRHLSD